MSLCSHEFPDFPPRQCNHLLVLSEPSNDAWTCILSKGSSTFHVYGFLLPVFVTISFLRNLKTFLWKRCHSKRTYLYHNLPKPLSKFLPITTTYSNSCLGHCSSVVGIGLPQFQCSWVRRSDSLISDA